MLRLPSNTTGETMKRQLARLVILGIVTCGTSVTHADFLSNGNLDSVAVSGQVLPTPVGWIASANKTISGPFNDGLSSENFANMFAAGGYGVFFKPFQGSTSDRINAS